MMEGLQLARALWSGEPVTWSGRWTLDKATVGPTPHRPGGPLLWSAGTLPAALERAGRFFDGWMPNEGKPEAWASQWGDVKRIAREAGRDADALTGSIYLTLSLDEDVEAAQTRLDRYLETYYNAPAVALKKRQECFAGRPSDVAAYLSGYARAGARHLVLRFAGDQVAHLEAVAAARSAIAT